MCAIFGYLDYKGIIDNTDLKKLIKALSVEAECRGTDATGISYVNDGNIITFKKPKPAHKVKLYFPADTKCVIGHTRFATQGDEKFNYNNHPFESEKGFALAHNGVLYNDKELRKKYMLPDTKIETDSYIAVQLIDYFGNADMESIKQMSELVNGNFVFTILRNDNTLFLAKGSNPITIYHFEQLGIYIYASTKQILENAFESIGFEYVHTEIPVDDGEILQINPDGTAFIDTFKFDDMYDYRFNYLYDYDDYELSYDCYMTELLYSYGAMLGVSKEDIDLLLDYYDADTVDEFLMDKKMLDEALEEIKSYFYN